MSDNYYASVKWQDNTPRSTMFDDIYYSVASGIDESNYVFIEHNQLTEKFAKLGNDDIFIIGETGFGSGLNFLNVLTLWEKTVLSNAKLFFISFEKYPLTPADLKQINSKIPNFTYLADQYYLPLPATHRLSFKNNIFLNLVIGDIRETLPEQNFLADSWFLDGFTPTRNPEMWTDLIFNQIARLSKVNTTFASYTANSAVRKKLENAGFHVEKDKGFNKRNMLFGYWRGNLNTQKSIKPKPWFDRYKNPKTNRVIIIGGGISGASTAYSLAKRGYLVTLYEQNDELALAASGNYQAILYGSFSAQKTPIMELSHSGYRYSHYLIKNLLNEKKHEYKQCGLIELVQKIPDFLENLPKDFCSPLTHFEIEKLANICINDTNGLYFPYGLWLNPQSLINKLVTLPNITIKSGQKIDELKFIDNKWQLIQNDNIIDITDTLVLCNAHSIDQFEISKEINLRKIRGQISIVNPHNSNQNSHINTPEVILCGAGYITPPRQNKYTIGATFDFKNIHTSVTHADHQQNLSAAQSISNTFNNLNVETFEGQAAIRASTFDYMPLVGPLAVYSQFMTTYAKLAKDKNIWLNTNCTYHPGLYLNVGHGAKGMLTAPLCGEIIADYIDNTPLPCSEKLRTALHPNRIYVRKLVKG